MSSSRVADPALAQQARERGLDPPPPAHRQLLAGARFEQAGEDTRGAVAYLHSRCSSVREAIRRAILSGGSTAQASPASSTARGMPQTAQLASSWAMIEPPHATRRRRALDAVAAHAGEDDAERASAVDRAHRGEHRIDRGHAAAARCGRGSGARPAPFLPGSSVRCASPGARKMWSGSSSIPSSATTHVRCAIAPSWRAKTGMNGIGRCCVRRIGTPIRFGSA